MTSAGTFPTPFTSCHYYNKYINCEKLIDIRYTGLGKYSMKEFKQRYKMPDKKTINIIGTIREF